MSIFERIVNRVADEARTAKSTYNHASTLSDEDLRKKSLRATSSAERTGYSRAIQDRKKK